MTEREKLVETVRTMRVDAQSAYREGVEGIIGEIRRVAHAAERAIGEISIDEAFQVIERTVRERVAWLTRG